MVNFAFNAISPTALGSSADANASAYKTALSNMLSAATPSASTGATGAGVSQGVSDGTSSLTTQGFADPNIAKQLASNPQLSSFINSEVAQESGGNYNAQSSAGALGKYQILASNIPEWSKEILGYSITPQQFLASPQLQDQIAIGKLTQYYQQFGPEGAAKAWYAGPGDANVNSNAPQYGGPSIDAYAASVLKRAGLG